MNNNSFRIKSFAAVFAVLLVFSSFVSAQTVEKIEVKKLPDTRYIRSRDFDTKHIALDLKFDWSNSQTSGVERFTFAPLKNDFKQLVLDAGAMVFNSVKLEGGKDLPFSYDEKAELLTINFDRAYNYGEDLTVVIDYKTKGEVVANTLGFGGGGGLKYVKPENPSPSNPRQIWSQGESEYNHYWFPSYDYPNDFRTTEITATVEKPFMVISNGKLVETKQNADNTTTYHWKMDTPYANYLTSIVVGEFAEIKGEYAGIPVSTYVYKAWLEEGKATTKNLPAMVKFFSEKLNFKYPYVKYAQTTGNTFSGGMENISATTQTDNMIQDARSLIDNDEDGLQAHELAHQWFGDFVTCRDWGEIWLNESFATYMEGLWQLESKGKDYFLFNDLKNNQDQYLNAWKGGSRRPIVTKNYANPDAVFDTYAYPRGGAVLHMLRKQLGDANFFKSLNHYLTTNANQPVETEDLRIAIEETTGQSMDAFFDQWLYKMGHPVFEVTQNYDATAGKLNLKVKQVQQMDLTSRYPQVEFFQMPVDIEIKDGKGTRVETVFIKPQAENDYTFAVSGKPLLVDFDNEGTLIKEIKFEKSNEDLLYQMKNDGDVIGRNWALEQLRDRAADKQQIYNAFLNSAVNDPAWQIRNAAISNVAKLSIMSKSGDNSSAPAGNNQATSYDDATIQTLLKAAKDKNSQVRGNAISVLSATKDKKYADLYISSLKDQSYFVVNQAALALGRTGDQRAYDALTKMLGEKTWKNRVEVSALNGLAALGDKRALENAIKYVNDNNTSSGVRNSALGVIAATGKGDSRVYPLLFGNFKTALDNDNLQGIFTGIQAIAKLGDPRGQEAFDLVKEKFKDNKRFLPNILQLEEQFKKSLEDK